MTPLDRLRRLLAEPGFVMMPAVRDGMSAGLAGRARFAFMPGSCLAASRLGGPDLDLLFFAEMLDIFGMGRGASPGTFVLAEADHGYGKPINAQRTVRAFGRARAAAILIEDKVTPRALTAAGKPCLPRHEARMKVRAAVEAAAEPGILVMARTGCRPPQGIAEALAHIQMFEQEGAEILFMDSRQDEAEMRDAVMAARGRPSFAVLSPGAQRETPTLRGAEELGLKIGTYPHGVALTGGGRGQGGACRPAGWVSRRPGRSGKRRTPRGARLCRIRGGRPAFRDPMTEVPRTVARTRAAGKVPRFSETGVQP